MATKLYGKPTVNPWSKQNTENLRRKHNFKYEVGDLVSKYPGCVWEIIDLGFDANRGGCQYHLIREVGNSRKRWKSVWACESDIQGVFVH